MESKKARSFWPAKICTLHQMPTRSCRRPMENNTGNPYRDSSSICEVEGCSNQKPYLLTSTRVLYFSSLLFFACLFFFYLLLGPRLCPSFSFLIAPLIARKKRLLSTREFLTSMPFESKQNLLMSHKRSLSINR